MSAFIGKKLLSLAKEQGMTTANKTVTENTQTEVKPASTYKRARYRPFTPLMGVKEKLG